MSVPIFVEFRGGLTDFVAKMGVVNGELDKMALKGASTSSKLALAGKAAALGIAAVGVGVAVESVKMAGNFEQATNVLVTAAGESTKNLANVRKGILDISSGTGTSWQQVTDGMYLLEKAGYRGADALTVEKAAAQGAREEGANLGTVTQAITSIMASYHLKSKDAVGVMNEMKTAAGESKTTMEEFAGSLSTVLPLASANKISFADIAGSLASLTQHGTSADEAAQELAFTMRGLSAPNQVAQKEMAQLGISSNDVSSKLGDGPGGRGLAGTLNYLSKTVLDKMGPSGKVLLDTFNASKIAAKDAATEMASLPEGVQKLAKQYADGHLSLKDWNAGLKALPANQASLGKQWATTENSAKGFQQAIKSGVSGSQTYSDAIKKMTGGANGLNTTLQLTGESTAGTHERIKKIAVSAAGASKDVSGWASTQGLLNVRLDMWGQSIEAAAIKLGMKLIPYVAQAMDWLQKLSAEALPYVKQAIAWVSDEFDKLSAEALPYVKQAFDIIWPVLQQVGQFIGDHLKPILIGVGIAFALLTAPILTVVGGLVYAYEHFKTFHAVVDAVVKFLISAGVAVWHAVGAAIQWFIDNPLKWIKQRIAEFQAFWHAHGKEIQQIAHDAWTFISGVVKLAWSVIWDGVLKPGIAFLKATWKPAWDVIRDVVKTVWDVLKDIVTTGYKLVLDAIGVFLDLMTGHWSDAWSSLKKLVSDAWDGVVGFFHDLSKDAVNLLYDVGKLIIKGLVNGIKASFNSVKNTLSDLTGKLTSWKGPPEKDATLLYSAGKSIIHGLVRGIADSFSSVKSVLTDLTVFIGGALHQSGADSLASLIEKDNGKLKTAAANRDAVVKQLTKASSDLKTLQDAQASLVQSVTQSAQGYAGIGSVQADANGDMSSTDIVTQMQQRLDQITAFRGQIDNLKTQGINSTTLQDIISAGVDKGGQMATAIQAGGRAAVDQLNSIQAQINQQAVALGTTAGDNMYAAGIQAAQGLVDGLTSQESVLNATMKRLAQQMVDALQKATTPSRDAGAGKGAHDPGAGTRAPGHDKGGAVHVHFDGVVVGGDSASMATLGAALAGPVRDTLLNKKRSGQMTTIGLS